MIETYVLLVERKLFTLLYYMAHTFCQLRANTPHSLGLLSKCENDQKRRCLLITNTIGC